MQFPRVQFRMACLAALALSVYCAEAQEKVALQTRRVFEFAETGIRFSNQFPGGRLNDCSQIGEDKFQIVIRPESERINNSAWYAFQVVADESRVIEITLTYENGKHRYDPKVSRDGKVWKRLEGKRFVRDREAKTATLTLAVDRRPLWVAGQPLIGVKEIEAWSEKLAKKSFVSQAEFGKSMRGYPLRRLRIGDKGARNHVIIISRQHPPEITGTIGMMAFVEKLADGSKLSRRFRAKFKTWVVPLMNPDGVNEGHWRHNLGGVDLNRDWKVFFQPETRAVRDLISRIVSAPNTRPVLFLDFHSTYRDVFYTQLDKHETVPKDFTKRWLAAIGERFPDYRIRRDGSHNVTQATSKWWAYENLGVPAITYELGDETDRDVIERVARGAAEEAMKLLLETAGDF